MNARTTLARAAAATGIAAISLSAVATGATAAVPIGPSFTLAVPSTIHAGADPTEFTGHLAAPDGGQNLWVTTDITGADASDVHLEWMEDGTWKPMPATPIEDGIRVGFGDGDADHDGVRGFSVPANYAADTRFRIALDDDASHGTVHWTTRLVTGNAGVVLGSTSGDLAVSVDPTFALDVPTTLVTGADATPFTGTLTALDDAKNLWVRTDVTGPAADHLRLEWMEDGTWKPMPATPIEDGIRVGFGDGDADHDGVRGFSVPAGYTADTPFRIAVTDGAAAGTVHWTSSLVTGDAGTVLSSTSGTVAIDLPIAGKATLAAPTTPLQYGRTVHLSGRLVDVNHADAALAGRAVSVYKKTAGAPAVRIARATTNANGAFRATTPNDRTASYWVESGNARSAKATVRAIKAIHAVTVSRRFVAPGRMVRFTGVIGTPEKKQPVVLQVRKAGRWTVLATGHAGRLGGVKIRSKRLPRGEHRYRLTVTGSAGVAGNVSKELRVTVR